jgi:hypothetical protein
VGTLAIEIRGSCRRARHPATTVETNEQVEAVFKDGIGYDSEKLIASVRVSWVFDNRRLVLGYRDL